MNPLTPFTKEGGGIITFGNLIEGEGFYDERGEEEKSGIFSSG